jgi:hypothetical protein
MPLKFLYDIIVTKITFTKIVPVTNVALPARYTALAAVRAFPRRVLTGTYKAKSIPTPIPENSFSVFYGYRDP